MAQEIEEGSHCSEEKRVMAPGHQIPRIEFTNAGPPPPQRSMCLCFLSARIKGLCYHSWL